MVHRDRHKDLFELTLVAALVGKEVVFNQLLGNGTATLDHASCQEILHKGTADRDRVDTKVLEVGAILDLN